MSERHVAINDTWIPITGQGGKFYKMGEVITVTSKNDIPPGGHFRKVPSEIRGRESLGKFVQAEHGKYELEKRQKKIDTARNLDVNPAKFGV